MNITLSKIVTVNKSYTIVVADDGNTYRLTGGTLAWRNNNPGNLKYGEFSRDFGALSPGWENHAIFPSYNIGGIAQQQLLFSTEGSYYNLSIKDAIAKYAPVDDPNPIAKNNPTEYATYVANHTGVSVESKLQSLNETQQVLLLKAMRTFDGFKEGTIAMVTTNTKD